MKIFNIGIAQTQRVHS